MKTLSFSATINLSATNIDLYEWLINITESEYQQFSTAHLAIGRSKKKDGDGMVNVESIGGNLLVQHYTFQKKDRNRVVLYSEKSDVYLFHVLRLNVSVQWSMSLKPVDDNHCLFICEIGVQYPNQLLPVAAQLTGGNYFLRKHLNEEGEHFAKNIESKYNR